MKIRALVLAALAAGLVMVGSGCANKESAERSSLLSQNDDLKKQLDAEKAARQAAEARAAAIPSTPAPTDTVKAPTMDNSQPLDLSSGPGLASSGKAGSKSPARSGTALHGAGGGEVVLDVMEIPGDVLFDSGKATLKPSASKSLDAIAATIKKQYASQKLRIEGHTDPTPVKGSGWDNNYDLGAARATAVLHYLVKKGIPEKNMYIASFGANDLKSTKNYALDRRVDIVVVSASAK